MKEIVKFEKDYPKFIDFQNECMSKIFVKIVDTFDEIIKSNEKEKEILFISTVEGVTFETTINVNIDEKNILTDNILWYFEQTEDYEMCARIMKLCN